LDDKFNQLYNVLDYYSKIQLNFFAASQRIVYDFVLIGCIIEKDISPHLHFEQSTNIRACLKPYYSI